LIPLRSEDYRPSGRSKSTNKKKIPTTSQFVPTSQGAFLETSRPGSERKNQRRKQSKKGLVPLKLAREVIEDGGEEKIGGKSNRSRIVEETILSPEGALSCEKI